MWGVEGEESTSTLIKASEYQAEILLFKWGGCHAAALLFLKKMSDFKKCYLRVVKQVLLCLLTMDGSSGQLWSELVPARRVS